MSDNKTKIGYGAKNDIQSAIDTEVLNECDIVITSDTSEFAFVNPDKDILFAKSRSSKQYTLNGTSIGALNDGESIPAGVDIDDFLNMITQKAIAPTYTKPTISIANASGTAAGGVEAGTTIQPKLKATFTKNDAGDLVKISVLKDDSEVGSDSTSPYTYNGENFVIGDTTVTYKATAEYGDGEIKNNNLNQPDATGQIKEGSISSSSYSIIGQRNLFYGTGVGSVPELSSDVIRNLQNKKLNPTQGYSWEIPVAIGQQYVIFAYRANLRDVNQVMYVETNDTGMASSFTKSEIDVADARGGENGKVAYKVYTYGMAVPAAAPMTFKITI